MKNKVIKRIALAAAASCGLVGDASATGVIAVTAAETGACRQVMVMGVDMSQREYMLVRCAVRFHDGSEKLAELKPSHHSNPAAICGIWASESWDCPFSISLQK